MEIKRSSQTLKSPENLQRFLKPIERSESERFARTEKNVDNRIQYVGKIESEGNTQDKKPKSRIIE